MARGITDPTADVSLAERARARLLTNAAGLSGAEIKAAAKAARCRAPALPVGAAGSGSDFSGFLDHAGVTTLIIGFGGEGEGGGVYHSAYDTFEHHTNFDDPGLVYGKVMAEMVGHSVIAAADAEMPLQTPKLFATYMASYAGRVEHLADDARPLRSSRRRCWRPMPTRSSAAT